MADKKMGDNRLKVALFFQHYIFLAVQNYLVFYFGPLVFGVSALSFQRLDSARIKLVIARPIHES